ncbi:MAG: hypothetical protein IKA36_03300 [Clostridia bacterium]|nr:hypothetical protein [Clostridia bacterium]
MNTLLSTLLEKTTTDTWVDELTGALRKLITPILALLAAAGVIYAIVVGIRFVKADDKSARDEAKQKLITVIIGIGVTLVLIALFLWLSSALTKDGALSGWYQDLTGKDISL